MVVRQFLFQSFKSNVLNTEFCYRCNKTPTFFRILYERSGMFMDGMYLKRKIDSYLIQWKNNPERKPLIVKGPRQVGKTESICRFARENYESVIYINFVEEAKYKLITDDGYKTEDIIRNISRMNPYEKFIRKR